MPTNENLRYAIEDGDHVLVESILSERDSKGVPLVDINAKYRSGFDSDSHNNAFYLALYLKPSTLIPILISLLRVQDYANNYVIDIKDDGSWGDFNTSYIMKTIDDAPSRLMILKEIFNTKMANGKRRTTASKCSLWTAYDLNDYECFQFLCNVKNIDKEHAPNINYLVWGAHTALDKALDQNYHYPSEINLKWIDAILQQGGLRFHEVNNRDLTVTSLKNRKSADFIEIYRLEMEPVRLRLENLFRDEPDILINPYGMLEKKKIYLDGQFTSGIYIIMDENLGSLKALHNYYNKLDINAPIIQKIKDFMTTFYNKMKPDFKTTKNREKIQIATRFLQGFVNDSEINIYGFNLQQILALVWEGIIDHHEVSLPFAKRAAFDINAYDIATNTIVTFIDKLNNLDSSHELNEMKGWALDKENYAKIITYQMLEVLNGKHIAVYLIPNVESVKSQANDMAMSTLYWKFMNLSISERKEILRNWNLPQSKASNFKKTMIPIINEKLNFHFNGLLTPEDIENITSSIKDLPKPQIPHRGLNYLADKLEKKYILPFESKHSKPASGLRIQLFNIYHDNSKDDDEKYEKLQASELYFESLERVAEKYSTLKSEYLQNSNNQIPNRQRLKDIDDIEICIQNAYIKEQPNISVKQIVDNLISDIHNIARRMSFLGVNISNSSLYPLLNHKMSIRGHKPYTPKKGFFARIISGQHSNSVAPVATPEHNRNIPKKT